MSGSKYSPDTPEENEQKIDRDKMLLQSCKEATDKIFAYKPLSSQRFLKSEVIRILFDHFKENPL